MARQNSGISAQDALRAGRIAARLSWTAAPLACLTSLLLMAIGGITPAASAWLQRAVLDDLVGTQGTARRDGDHAGVSLIAGHVLMLAIALSCVALVTAIVPYARRYTESELRRKLGFLIQDNIYRAINSFPGISRFESPRFSDKLQVAQRVANGTGNSFVTSMLGLGQALITAVTLGLALYIISPVMSALMAASAVPAVWAQLRNSGKQADLAWRTSPTARRQMFYARLLTDQTAAKEIRLFGLGDFLRGRMLTELRDIQHGQRSLDRRIFRVEGFLSLLSSLISAGGLFWIIWQVADAELPIGDVTMFTVAILGVQAAISGAVTSLAQLAQSMLLFSHYGDVVSMGPDLQLTDDPRPLPSPRKGIAVKDVWFRYDEGHPWVLRGLGMFIPAGAAVAVVGLNGAGKSTLVKLLCRLYDPTQGSITWDGVDIREIDPSELRKHIGTVFQDYMSYDFTAAENIGVGDLVRLNDREGIEGAGELAGAGDIVARLPEGYNTLLSRTFSSASNRDKPQAGITLSGGQWQRLAIARGFMRADRDLLILDEPSSGLDAEAEATVHRQMRALREGRTSLLISHRLSTVRDASLIYVLAQGQVAEQGTHETLMAFGGEYCRLFTLQASGYQDGFIPTGMQRRTTISDS